ncbi:unnamed protein product [Rhizophagus irregularis]|nr:unnamed protein product [Rhizophagus irregularis]
MLFQYQLPELPEILEVQEIIHDQQQLFRQNSFSQKTFHTFNLVFEKLLAFSENFTYQSDFDESDIRNQIMTYFKVGCNFSPPNIIILDAGDPPSSDSAVHKCLKMYENEISIGNNNYINVVADEAIFRHSEDSSPPPPLPSPPSFPNKPCPGLHSEQIVTYINRTPATYGGA